MRQFWFFILAGCMISSGAAAGERLTAFVSIPPQKYLVERVGGDRVQVHVMLKPGQAPETYDPAPRQMAQLATAQIYFRIGVPFERRWIKTIAGQNPGLQVVECCAQMVRDGDPHTWVDPNNARAMAAQIKEVLSRRLPEGATSIAANYAALAADLEQLDRDILTILNNRRTDYFIVSHSGWRYFADAYGLRQLALDDNGREKGPRGLADLVTLARREGIRTVFIQAQHPTGAAYTLARELDAAAVTIDNLAEDYIDNLYQVSKLIAGALQ
jgi:zinc transport system substrate-binding protein